MDGDKAAPILLADSIDPDVIVHVGAHVGQEINSYMELRPRQVVLIEADPEIFQILQNRMQEYDGSATQIICINALIASTDSESINFYRYSNNGESSSIYRATKLLRETWSGIKLDETGEVLTLPTRSLKSLLIDLGLQIGRNSVLILDIQGAELEALTGLNDYLSKFDFLEIEISKESIYDSAPLFDDIDSYLTSHDFVRLTSVPWHGDVVYRRVDKSDPV